ncbi:hypothetical protein V7114_19395 [Neobacillus niacini]
MDLFYYFFPKIRPFLEVINTVALIWIVVLLKQLVDRKKYLNNK